MLIVEYIQRREPICDNIGKWWGSCSEDMVLIRELKQRRVPSDKSRPYHSYCLTTLYSFKCLIDFAIPFQPSSSEDKSCTSSILRFDEKAGAADMKTPC